jgi:heterodisulfide reductase subunit A-like polyferredoxin
MTTGAPSDTVLVVGAGIAGIQAALDLASGGLRVLLLDTETSVGGRMALLDKTFPTNDCAQCTLSPRLLEVGRHDGITLLTGAELLAVDGEPGHLRARVRLRPRGVDLARCTGCGECARVCPVAMADPVNPGRSTRPAIHRRLPQAVPGAFAVRRSGRSPCRDGCPAGVNVQAMVALIGAGRVDDALAVIRTAIPLPASLGRICPHPCETVCGRGEADAPVALGALHRFAADAGAPAPVTPGVATGAKVAIIGSGPAGLACADDLARAGHPVTILEARAELGGLLRHGIPAYRLPRDVLDRELHALVSHPLITVRTSVRLGEDLTLDALRQEGFGAVLVAVGAAESRRVDVPGAHRPGVSWGLEALQAGPQDRTGRRVVVVGGGNVAVDVARVARRQGAEVQLVCLELPEEMPASAEEVTEAREEGCALLPGHGVAEVLGDEAGVTGLRVLPCLALRDEAGRFAPRLDPARPRRLPADEVIFAVGQRPALGFLAAAGLAPGPGGAVAADPETGQTAVPWIFAGGDARGQAGTAVEAIRDGHRAAAAIRGFLSTDPPAAAPAAPALDRAAPPPPPPRWARTPRAGSDRAPAADRVTAFGEVVSTLSPGAARSEAGRCLACGGCCDCGSCTAVCQAEALRPAAAVEDRDLEVGAVILAAGLAPAPPAAAAELGLGELPDVITTGEVERLLAATGPTGGHLRRPSDGATPRRVAWIRCVGSRDVRAGRDHCSAVCCLVTAKQAGLAAEHHGVTATIFHTEDRPVVKGGEAFAQRIAARPDVRLVRAAVSAVREVPGARDLRITWMDPHAGRQTEDFDLVVLATGLAPSDAARALAARLGVAVDPGGFVDPPALAPTDTTRPGIQVAGSLAGPRDIPESVAHGSAAAGAVAALLSAARFRRGPDRPLPPERDVTGEAPRIGVFVCRCGVNIAGVVDVPAVVAAVRPLPGVVLAVEALFTCSQDHTAQMVTQITEHRLNRVVVASCSPRTHEKLFQTVLREAGLNPHLFTMANIRDQCSWVHGDTPAAATAKAIALTRQAVGFARRSRALPERRGHVTPRALVVGGGLAGLVATRALARQGFGVDLVERTDALGGMAHRLPLALATAGRADAVPALITEVTGDPRVRVHLGSEVAAHEGVVGQFRSRVRHAATGADTEVAHGVTIVATGARAATPAACGTDPRVITQLDLEAALVAAAPGLTRVSRVVMLQCADARTPEDPACRRVCCAQAVRNALALRARRPDVQVAVLHRDLRTYGRLERLYREARRAGVMFLRYEAEAPPLVTWGEARGEVRVAVPEQGRTVVLPCDRLVLAVGPVPDPQEHLRAVLKLGRSPDGFLQEAHAKLRPVDLPADGMFLCGTAHSPLRLPEVASQALAAAGRAGAILARGELVLPATVSTVDPDRCAACLTCVRLCPYGVPRIVDPGVAFIEAAACRGCGTCVAGCPASAIELATAAGSQYQGLLAALTREVTDGD